MTRSSTKELFTPFKEPEQKFQSSRKLLKTLSLDESRSLEFNLFSDLEEYYEEEVAETMAETIEQYMSKTRADYGLRIARPKIDDKYSFELKGQILKELRDNTFGGLNHKDANEHIKKVLEIVDLFHIPNITLDQVMLRAFLMSLTGHESLAKKQTSRCEQCKGPHYTKDFPLKEEGKPFEEAYYTQFGGPFQGGDRAAAPGFYQRNNANPSYQEHMKSMEETLSKFMSESTKRHEENSNMIKEIQDSMDADVQNQGALIKTLEIQIGKISKELAALDHQKTVLSTTHAKIDVFKKKITSRVGDEKIIFKSVKPANSLIKRVYMLSLKEIMELNLEARLMEETLVLNRSLDPLYGDYIKLNDLNVPLKLRLDQVDDLMPTIKEGEVIDEPMIDIIKTWNNKSFDEYPSFCDFDRKIHIDCVYNLIFSCMIGSQYAVFQFMDTAYWSLV
nr:hypothetical protein [Tanacetum cinerariifolium]